MCFDFYIYICAYFNLVDSNKNPLEKSIYCNESYIKNIDEYNKLKYYDNKIPESEKYFNEKEENFLEIKNYKSKVLFKNDKNLIIQENKVLSNTLTVRDRLNFLRKESYEKIKLVSKSYLENDSIVESKSININNKKNELFEELKEKIKNQESNENNDININQKVYFDINTPIYSKENGQVYNYFNNKKENENEDIKKNFHADFFKKNEGINLKIESSLNEEKSYTSRLVTSIPIKITLELERKAKVGSIIDIIKNMDELELEKLNDYTNLILMDQCMSFIDTELKIDECFQNNQTIDIYEILNSTGIHEIVWKVNKTNKINLLNNSNQTIDAKKYDDINSYNSIILEENQIKEEKLKKINYETLKLFRMPILDFRFDENKAKFEFLVEIVHRFISEKEYYLFNQSSFNFIQNFPFDALILNNTVIKKYIYIFIF